MVVTQEEFDENARIEREARLAILKAVADLAPNASASYLRDLAEAYAWAMHPGQPHGSRTAT